MKTPCIDKRKLRLKTSRDSAGGFLRFYSNSFSSPRSRSRRRRIPFACRSQARFFKRVLWATPLSPNYPPESLGKANLSQYACIASDQERGICVFALVPSHSYRSREQYQAFALRRRWRLRRMRWSLTRPAGISRPRHNARSAIHGAQRQFMRACPQFTTACRQFIRSLPPPSGEGDRLRWKGQV